jgi:hypothetical protein
MSHKLIDSSFKSIAALDLFFTIGLSLASLQSKEI